MAKDCSMGSHYLDCIAQCSEYYFQFCSVPSSKRELGPIGVIQVLASEGTA